MGVMLIGAWNGRYRLACMYISFAIKGDILKISLTRRTSALIKALRKSKNTCLHNEEYQHSFYSVVVVSVLRVFRYRNWMLRKGREEPGEREL